MAYYSIGAKRIIIQLQTNWIDEQIIFRKLYGFVMNLKKKERKKKAEKDMNIRISCICHVT